MNLLHHPPVRRPSVSRRSTLEERLHSADSDVYFFTRFLRLTLPDTRTRSHGCLHNKRLVALQPTQSFPTLKSSLTSRIAATQMDDVHSHRDGDESSRSLLEEVLDRLPHHNLEDHILCSPIPKSSVGGFSDIYTGSFKAGALRDSPLSPYCLVCRTHKEELFVESCSQCAKIWEGALAIKKIRVHIRGRNHVKVRDFASSKIMYFTNFPRL